MKGKIPVHVLLVVCILFGAALTVFGMISGDGVNKPDINTELESRLEKLLSEVNGISDVRVMIHDSSGDPNEIVGIAVVCKASDKIKAEVSMLISSLFGVPSSRVYVTG